MIIEIEGIDGVGKTTQISLLKQTLKEAGHKVLIVKDLESTEIGRKMKEMFVSDTPRDMAVELFGFLCCKAQLFSEVVAPALNEGCYVLCDRGFGSQISYFEAHGFEREKLEDMLAIAVPVLRPAYTILLDTPVGVAMSRNMNKESLSKFDNMGVSFFERQRSIYLSLCERTNWYLINAERSIEELHQEVLKVLKL